MFNNLEASKKILSAFAAVGLLAALSSAALIWSLLVVARNGETVGARLSPQVDAITEIMFEGTYTHLVMEEIMAGDTAESIDEVRQHLENARFFANAMLNGATHEEGTLVASESAQVRQTVKKVLAEIDDLALAVDGRYALLGLDQSAGSGADEEFDQLYEGIVADLAAVPNGQRMPDIQRLLGDARFLMAHGHLILEEVLSGGEGEVIEESDQAFADAKAAVSDAARLDPSLKAMSSAITTSVDRLAELSGVRYSAFLEMQDATEQAEIEFDAAYDQFMETSGAAELVVQQAMDEGLTALSRARSAALVSASIFAVLLSATILLSYKWLDRVLGKRLRQLGGAMRELTEGNLNVALPEWNTTDEVGLLRGSLDDLREAFVRQKQLEKNVAAESAAAQKGRDEAEAAMARAEVEKQNAETQKRAVEERAQKAESFVTDFRAVVEEACAGRFDARIQKQAGEPDLDALAASLNQLMQFIDKGISETSRVLSLVSRGNLGDTMQGDFKGAFSDLQSDLNASVGELNSIVSGLTEKSVAIVEDAKRMRSSSDALAQRSTSQAASLEETAAAISQVTSIVSSNEKDSQLVAERAKSASERAVRGGDVVTEAIRAVKQIDENARKVSDIIKVINDISFQTNLLALNAGVEAARAGQAGKGFAVVAQEVRALAQRASDAAKDIGTLIESSGRDVEEGVRLVTSTGSVLGEIAEAITEVTEITERIASSSREQTSAINEISSTISELDRITQQNANMAVETVGLAQSLNGHSDSMVEMIGFFDHGPSAGGPRSWKDSEPAAQDASATAA